MQENFNKPTLRHMGQRYVSGGGILFLTFYIELMIKFKMECEWLRVVILLFIILLYAFVKNWTRILPLLAILEHLIYFMFYYLY